MLDNDAVNNRRKRSVPESLTILLLHYLFEIVPAPAETRQARNASGPSGWGRRL